MKRLKLVFTVILAVVMAIIPVMQAAAAGKTQYISEIRIGYGEDGKAALEKEGFAVWTDLNANEGGNGSEVWLGYKTTENADEAITDISLMNMQGGYSFDAYTEEIAKLNMQISEQLSNFKAAINEFRNNYRQGNPYAVQAYALLNLYYDDESVDSEGNPKGIGDLFLNKNIPDDTVHRIFLEGNTEAISAIEQALALGCIEIGEENLLTRLEDAEYPEALDPDKNADRSALRQVFEDFHYDALAAQTAYETVENYEDGAEAFFEDNHLSEEEAYLYGVQTSRYALLTETSFGDTGMSLLDFALLDETEENKYGEVLEDEYLEMLASSMTEGQLGIVANVGVTTILINAAAGSEAEDAKESFSNLEAAETSVSVYYGVDRSLFEDIDSIALTSDALREKAAAEANNFGKDANIDRSEAIKWTSAAAATMAAGTIATILGVKAIIASTANTGALVEAYKTSDALFKSLDTILEEYIGEQEFLRAHNVALNSAVSVGGVITTILGCIAIIAGVVITIFAILQWIEKPTVPDTEYTQIPRVIVEKSEDDSFIPYYAAKLAGAAEDETDSTKLYGDLNGLNGIDQWVGLYYTKNTSVGSPITAEMLISSDGVLSNSQAEKYAAVHMFGSTSAANLNQYNTKEGAKAIYIFLRTDNSAVSQTGSIFTTGTVVTGIAAFAAGAGIAAAVTYLLTRKKKSEAVED